MNTHAFHASIIGLMSFAYMMAFNHGPPTELRGPLFDTTSAILAEHAFHASMIGLMAFAYMMAFNHGLPTELRGPLFKY